MNIEELSKLDILLADRATGDLELNGYRELAALADEDPDLDNRTDLAAAALMLALIPEDEEPMPQHLRQSLMAMAPIVKPDLKQTSESPATVLREPAIVVKPVFGIGAILGWVAAAASVLFALWTLQTQKPLPIPDLFSLRQTLATEAVDKVELPWSATEDPSAIGASGDVLWSNEKQLGFMRIRGLEANNASQVQYQLWIFDESRENPVDGGVFDVPAGQSEVLVPIDAKLKVQKPTLFAITVEQPGGVVVSKRERIVLVAKPDEAG